MQQRPPTQSNPYPMPPQPMHAGPLPVPVPLPIPGQVLPVPQPGSVIVGQPMIRAPVIMVAPPMFPGGPPPGWTPSLATSAPPNPLIVTPITIYVGKLPTSLKEDQVRSILEACGRVQKWSRPTDAAGLPKPFGFCTFEHGISGLRCFRALGGLSLADLRSAAPEAAEPLQVKAGTKEQAVLDSLTQYEKNTEPGSGERLDAETRERVMAVLRNIAIENCVAARPPTEPYPGHNAVSGGHSDSAIAGLESAALGVGLSQAQLDPSDPERERLVVSEIEKFRQRQLARDKEVEEQRKVRLRERIQQLKDKQEREKAEAARRQAAERAALALQQQEDQLAKSLRNVAVQIKNSTTAAAPASSAEAEAELKRARKQQVLENLGAGVSVDINTSGDTESAHPAPGLGAGPIAAPVAATASFTPLPPASSSFKLAAAVAGSKRPSGWQEDEEEETATRRAPMPIELTEEERRQAEEYYKQQEMLLRAEAENQRKAQAAERGEVDRERERDRDREKDRERKRDRSRERSRERSRTRSRDRSRGRDRDRGRRDRSKDREKEKERDKRERAAPLSAEESEKLRLKRLADSIPTDREALFSQAVDWEVAERHQLVDNSLRGWIDKKMGEYLGAAEAEARRDLTAFICSNLALRCQPADLQTELAAVLDEDAAPFMLKLWRMLVFSILKLTDTNQ